VSLHIVVVGGGVMGCAAALAAVRAGHQVRLLEEHRIGSSHGASRIIRLSYGRSDYIPLARRSFALWREVRTMKAPKQLGLERHDQILSIDVVRELAL